MTIATRTTQRGQLTVSGNGGGGLFCARTSSSCSSNVACMRHTRLLLVIGAHLCERIAPIWCTLVSIMTRRSQMVLSVVHGHDVPVAECACVRVQESCVESGVLLVRAHTHAHTRAPSRRLWRSRLCAAFRPHSRISMGARAHSLSLQAPETHTQQQASPVELV